MPVAADRVRMTTATTGTGTVTLGSAVTGYRTFAAAGIPDQSTVSYTIEDTNGAWECGLGTYTASGTTLARTTVYASSNSNAALSLTGNAQVYITLLSEQLPGSPGAYTTRALPYSATAADRGTTINPTGADVLTLTAATAVAGWNVWIKKRDEGGVATITPASGKIDGLSFIKCYKEEFQIYYDLAASVAAGSPVYRTQGRQRGWVDFGTFTPVAGSTVNVTITNGFDDTEIKDIELNFFNFTPSQNSTVAFTLNQTYNGGSQTASGLMGGSFAGTGTSLSYSSVSTNTGSITTATNSSTTAPSSGFCRLRNSNSNVKNIPFMEVESTFNLAMFKAVAYVSSGGAVGNTNYVNYSLVMAPGSGTLINTITYNVRFYRP